MKKLHLSLFIFLWMSLMLSSAYAQDYYVSALTGVDTNDGLTPETPLATIQKGSDLVEAGGTVFIMNGRYNRTVYGPVLEFRKTGTPEAYITFKPFPGHNPIISSTGGSWDTFEIDGSYVIIDGLELEGANASLKLEDAQEAYLQSRRTPAVFNARYNTNGISVGKYRTPHHIIIRNCKIHDYPGGGMGVGKCDYVTVENNVIYNNSWFTMYATSGISVLGATPIDDVTTYKIIIRGNTVYNNYTQVFWRTPSGNDRLSDGNGIILDANNGAQGTSVYLGRTLVENNVSYNNGGGGIHAYQVSFVDIINNTTYNNGLVVGYPEIDGQDSRDVKIYNNIMYARTGGNCNINDPSAVYNYNVYFNGPAFRQGPNDIVIDPQFVNLAKDASADFRLKSTSPIINTGSNIAGQFSPIDILGIARPRGSRSDRGAYEYQSGATAQTITFAELPTGKKAGDLDFDPAATASSGLPVIYKSSNVNVATIVNGKIRFEGQGTTIITAAQNGDATYTNAPDVTKTLTVLDDGFRVAELPLSTINGLDYNYYEGSWTQLPDFKTLTAVKSGTSIGVDLTLRQREENFGFTFKGYIDIPASGVYTFYTSSADGSRLYIGDSLIVNNDGVHGVTEQSGVIGLKKGKHSITIAYFNGAAVDKALALSYSSPVIAKTAIPASSFFRSNPNLIANSTFNLDTSGWSLGLGGGAAATVEQVEKAGYAGKAVKIAITAPGTGATNIQFRTNVPLVKDYTYTVRFRASADAARTMDFLLQMNVSPFANNFSRFGTALTVNPTLYTYTFTAPRTDSSNLVKFNVGNSLIPVYIDDVEIVRAFSPEMLVKQGQTEIVDNTGTFNFGNLAIGEGKTVSFTILNIGNNVLNLTGNPTITVGGAGFTSPEDAPVIIAAGDSATFQIRFQPNAAKAFSGTVSIGNNDLNENPYNFIISGTGAKFDQTITFNTDSASITYGDSLPLLAATSTGNLPVSFAVISGPGVITQGNILSYTGVGTIVVEATQAGDIRYNPAAAGQRSFTVNKKELIVKADDKTLMYGDTIPAYTYTIAGFVFGQSDTVLTGSPELSSTYTSNTPATESPVITVSASTLSSPNYSFRTVNGKITINHTFPLFLEAEKAFLRGGKIAAKFGGYTGTGYVTGISKPNDYIQWVANASGAGVCTLKFRYALKNVYQDLQLTVNGVPAAAKVRFQKTGQWYTWATVSVTVYLNAGYNTIKLNGVYQGGPNFDNLTVESDLYPSSVQLSSARFSPETNEVEAQSDDNQSAMQVYPVPAVNELKVAIRAKTNETITVYISNMLGQVVYQKEELANEDGVNILNLDISSIKSGKYALKVTTPQIVRSAQIAIEK